MNKLPDYTYENTNRVSYHDEYNGDAIFISVCPHCRRYVKADEYLSLKVNKDRGIIEFEPNATCSKCGRVNMPHEGFF